jgi:hypothetical protein
LAGTDLDTLDPEVQRALGLALVAAQLLAELVRSWRLRGRLAQ